MEAARVHHVGWQCGRLAGDGAERRRTIACGPLEFLRAFAEYPLELQVTV